MPTCSRGFIPIILVHNLNEISHHIPGHISLTKGRTMLMLWGLGTMNASVHLYNLKYESRFRENLADKKTEVACCD